jgi:hypothetical protein
MQETTVMFTFPISRRQADRPHFRRSRTHRPLIEDLEGRRLLSFTIGKDIDMSAVPAVVGNQIGTPVIDGNHIGTSVVPAIVGNHIGTNVA